MIFINPGSGPVATGTKEHAHINITALAQDIGGLGHEVWIPAQDPAESTWDGHPDGRWQFTIEVDGNPYDIEIPGLPLDQVRYLGESGQNIWDFPRLYVDGSSWIWKFALRVIHRHSEAEGS